MYEHSPDSLILFSTTSALRPIKNKYSEGQDAYGAAHFIRRLAYPQVMVTVGPEQV
jgi:hypothetical protein